MSIDISFKTDITKKNYTSKTYNNQNYITVEEDTLQGDLNLNNNKITNVGNPTDEKDCTTESYVDQQIEHTKTILQTKQSI